MLLIEVFIPRDTLSEREQRVLARRLIDGLMVEDDSHAIEIIEAQRLLTQVLVHEPSTWVLGQRPATAPSNPPRYLVRVTVPASWRKDVAEHTVRFVTSVLARTEREAGRDPERIVREPHAVVLVDGVTEGGIGIHGRAMGTMELTELVSRPYRDRAADSPAPEPEDGTVTDPICGMSVTLDDNALTLVHEGVRYGFCHGLCRRAFADEHGVPLGSGSSDE
ncbi:hypothetical protein BAY61_21030 [Prauserella marina]|uniref:YHS domain-containing protein n=1 Tax=Prauserella marina TaxID=530584 RepID=A0A222VT00_9PSEU|nr:hypothetical protein [Prauserella marina]ASR37056.1 hypothetical protein BAY61_21030 [Prauserella marina]PWV79964.1 YHS domain-containing protein [Prauserella marina]SDD86087.1 YHS domain-containing protein [Prauserella marina]